MHNDPSVPPPMPGLARRRAAFVRLGELFSLFAEGRSWPGHACGFTEGEYATFDAAIEAAHQRNGWYTAANVRHALNGLAHMLKPEVMDRWLAVYTDLGEDAPARTVGLILAGNIPLVGFHDLLCTLLCGHRVRVKCASDDAGLTPAVVRLLGCLDPELAAQVVIAEGRLGGVEAVIATGSTNTARYFEHYFGHLPRIVRKGRTSVAVLDGSETEAELLALGEDVLRYFGLGCRNVGKVFLPRAFDLDRLFAALFPWQDILGHNKYANNYTYTRALWMLDQAPFLENGFFLLKEDTALHSPVSALFYERYDDLRAVEDRLATDAERIQCRVGHGHVPFGGTQAPGPDDYADGVDTVAFLLGLRQSVTS